jgi:hypothetical protein
MATDMPADPPRPRPLSRAGQAIIGALRASADPAGWIRQGDLADASGVKASTFSRTKTVLADRGLIEEAVVEREGRGRPAKAWRLCRQQALTGGIVLDAMGLHAAVVDMDEAHVSQWSGRAASARAATIGEDAARCMRRWAEEGLGPERFASVTIAAPAAMLGDRAEAIERELATGGVPGRVIPIGSAVATCVQASANREADDLAIGAWVGREMDARVMRKGGPETGSALDMLAGPPPGGVGRAFTLMDRAGATPPADPMDWDEEVFSHEGYKAWIGEVGQWLADAGLRGAAPRAAKAIWVSGPLPERVLREIAAAGQRRTGEGSDSAVRPKIWYVTTASRPGRVAALTGLVRLGDRP